MRHRPFGVAELAERVGLHPNTVRWHLGVLDREGVIRSRVARTSSRGRPQILYSLSQRAGGEERNDYRFLATMLTGTVAAVEDGATRAEEAGRAWGRYLVRRPAPLARVSEEEARREVVDLLDAQGFAPEAARGEIRMRRCPYHDLAETHPQIVCALHRGLMSGAFEELGTGIEVTGLDVFVEPDLCIAHLSSSNGA